MVERVNTSAARRLGYLRDLFNAEVMGRYGRVNHKRHAAKMITDGLIESVVVHGRDTLGGFTFERHQLTHKGRMLWCDHAAALGEP